MEFLINPIDTMSNEFDVDNLICPGNAYQCGCNTVAGCGCPQT